MITWREKLENPHPGHGKICKILIPKPLDVDAVVRIIPKGKLVTDVQIREKLAKDNGADKTCSKVWESFLESLLKQQRKTKAMEKHGSRPIGE